MSGERIEDAPNATYPFVKGDEVSIGFAGGVGRMRGTFLGWHPGGPVI